LYWAQEPFTQDEGKGLAGTVGARGVKGDWDGDENRKSTRRSDGDAGKGDGRSTPQNENLSVKRSISEGKDLVHHCDCLLAGGTLERGSAFLHGTVNARCVGKELNNVISLPGDVRQKLY